MTRIRNVAFLKSSNLRLLLREILKHQPISRAALARKLHVGHSTIAQLLKPLVDKKIVLERISGRSTGGRPPKLLSINPDAAYGIVVDLSGHRVRVALMNCALRVVTASHIDAREDIYSTLESIVQACNQLKTRNDGARILGVCVAISGVMDPVSGKISSSLIKDLENIRLLDFLKTRLSVTVVVENDANLSALGEFMKMEKETNNMFYIHMGEGLGGGLIIDRDIFRGDGGYSGEIGRIVYDSDTFQTVGDVYSQLIRSGSFNEDDIVKLLSTIVLNVVSVLDVINFVVGGTAFNIDERVLSKVEATVKRYFYGFDVQVRRATNEFDAMLVGAMEYLMENVLTNL
ncbi:MAG: ROK family protein [Pseudothermotoga sp.]|nr:ROK family protein [Pseudothermotoga sp.]